jgi:hypothetical protein
VSAYLGIHILNRMYSRLLQDGARLDEMHLVSDLIDKKIIEDDTNNALDASIIELLGNINIWCSWHEVPEAK